MIEEKHIKREISEEQNKRAAAALRKNPFAKLIGMKLIDLKPSEATIQIEMRDRANALKFC